MPRDEWLSHLEEWKECRGTIARLDGVLVDLRKYGFSLVTILITASGFFVENTEKQLSLPAVSIGIMVLITALFAVDRYYTILLSAAVERALDLEGPILSVHHPTDNALTQLMGEVTALLETLGA